MGNVCQRAIYERRRQPKGRATHLPNEIRSAAKAAHGLFRGTIEGVKCADEIVTIEDYEFAGVMLFELVQPRFKCVDFSFQRHDRLHLSPN